ncbi:4-amino-4-deoxy-L-arabinose transferase [Paenibacillus beijingensis]|uniref:4-amino-4-deoxy-L-arabinose transferase n=2 Tax=Paenibacillus beijingensis TaxID=1126833 RepID=A0A0D5NRH3_9BACL|nr:glycosyltransferase family 39 protein [Paenibacillus beijingensis]AJY77886.1 4-amino-4-deoxy-L-arabinose transferase [Paenibacillus beijingensis]
MVWVNAEPGRELSPTARLGRKYRFDLYVALIALLAAFLNGFKIWTDHYVNSYYTMTVGSMLQSFHNFFFASLDSAGSVTVDKPPLTFWIQTASAYLFGLHGWSVILPQALAGVGSVILLYAMVKPTFGTAAGRIAALAMAATPVAAAVARTNNIDAMLVFTLLLASSVLFKAAKTGKIWTLIGAFALIGAAFNMKMLQAYMVLPAFYLFYIIAARVSWRKKAGFLAAATGVLIIVSMSWAVIVDNIPEDKRPYIGSSSTNSVLELAFGYNGVSRLTGNRGQGGEGGPPGGFAPASVAAGAGTGAGSASVNGAPAAGGSAGGTADDAQAGQPGMPGDGAQGGQLMPGDGAGGQTPGMAANDGGQRGGRFYIGGGGAFNTGTKGPLRLFQSELSGQASWLLPFVGFALIAIFASFRYRNISQKHKEALFWLAWLVPVMGFFSIAGFFHQYYLIMLAPPAAALTGAGWSVMWNAYRERAGWTSWLLPAAVLSTTAFAWYIIHPYDGVIGSGWSIGIAAGGVMFTLLLAVANRISLKLSRITAVGALLLLFVGPLYWAATPITYGQSSMLPQAGPGSLNDKGGMRQGAVDLQNGDEVQDDSQVAGQEGGPGMPGQESVTLNEKALQYLKEHNTGETYLFAASDFMIAAPYIIDAGEKVISLRGFSGNDKTYTVAELEALVSSGKVKYFMMMSGGAKGGTGLVRFGSGGVMGGPGGNSEITSWIEEHGTVIPSEEWQGTGAGSSSDDGGFGGRGGSATLYEVKL